MPAESERPGQPEDTRSRREEYLVEVVEPGRGFPAPGSVAAARGFSAPGPAAQHLLSEIAADPDIEVIRQIASPGGGATLVVAMTAARASELREAFADRIIVERNAPLSPQM